MLSQETNLDARGIGRMMFGMTTRAQRTTMFERLAAEYEAFGARYERVRDAKYLFAMTPVRTRGKPALRQGFFAVVDGDRLGVVDRKVYRAIVAEAKAAGLSVDSLHVHARTCTYSGKNLHIYQTSVDGGAS